MKRPSTAGNDTTAPIQRPEATISDMELIRSEVNLLVFPFFALTTKGLGKKLETEFRVAAERDGERAEIVWNVSANPKYGYPGLFDREVHRAVEQIITEMLRDRGQVENPILLGSLYSICERMGRRKQTGHQEYGGREYRAIKRALERITTTSIKSEGTFFSKGEQKWVSEVFHLYDSVIFQGKMLRNGIIADTNYLYLSERYLQSLNSLYVKPLDYQYQRTLRSHIASRLYEILGVKFYGLRNQRHAQVRFRYSTLAQLLPVERRRYFAHVGKQLNPAHEELVATGFLYCYEWEAAREDGDWMICYHWGPRAKDEIRRARAEQSALDADQEALPGIEGELDERVRPAKDELSSEQQRLLDQLVGCNVSETTARGLVQNSASGTIEQWLEAIEYCRAGDRAAFLVRAIREDWQAPEEYLRAKEDQERQRQAQAAELAREQREREEEQRRREEAQQLDRLYESLSPQQREEVECEAQSRLAPFLRDRLQRERGSGQISELGRALLRSQNHEVLGDWIKEGRIQELSDADA